MLRFSRIQTNGIQLYVAEAGPADGRLVILLHGFPEFWYGWRNQIPALAERGFHVVAPDQRGYNLSDKPKGVASYDLDELAADVIGVARHFGREQFTVVGHDWGSAVGWWLATRYAERVERLVAMNAPHPAVWLNAMRNHPVQKKKSMYVRFFQLPWLPEFLLGLNGAKALSIGFRDSTRPNAFTEADLAEYRQCWRQPGMLTAAINYYRAAMRRTLSPPEEYRITCPALVIWGRRDAYGIPELATESVKLCTDGRLEFLDEASHWVQHDAPERVMELLVEFLG